MSDINFVIKLKKEIDEAKEQQARYKGQLDVLYKKLEDEYGVKTIEEAEALLEKKKKTLAVRKARLDKAIQGLEETIQNELES